MTSSNDLGQLGTIVCVFAHPDDETFTMGGILAAAAKNGQRVVVITATRGEGGVQDEERWPAEELASIRTAELQAALNILGVHEQHFLDYPDGACAEADPMEAAQRIVDIIGLCQPASIFTFGPDGLTGHPDHKTVSAWAQKARQLSGSSANLYNATLTTQQYEGFRSVDEKFNFFFNTQQPPVCDASDAAICLELTDELYELKINALRVMPSQYEKVFGFFEPGDLRGGFGVEAFVEVE